MSKGEQERGTMNFKKMNDCCKTNLLLCLTQIIHSEDEYEEALQLRNDLRESVKRNNR